MGKNLGEYTKEELIELVGQLKKRQKYGLAWEDKPENVVAECQQKLPVLTEDEDKHISGPSDEPTHLMIEGDNYQALAALNYTHAGKVDVIYIDPPYNTGNKDFIYNDSFVDKEDTFRHSKWLSFMEKRLRLAKNLLSDDGVIFISIDDNEQANLKLLCDKIFKLENFIDNFIWRRSGTGGLRGVFPVTTHEYMLCYARSKSKIDRKWVAPYSEESMRAFKYEDKIGKYKTQALYLTSLKQTDKQSYFIELPDSSQATPPRGIGAWRFIKESYQEALKNNLIVFKKVNNSPLILKNGERAQYNIYTKQYISHEGTNPPSIFPEEMVGQTRAARAELKKIFKKDTFAYAKPVSLMNYILKLVHKKQDVIILDFFAGSGTTGQAVLELNKEDGGHRQFILVTNNEADGKKDAEEEGIARKVTYPRIKTVISGIRPDGTKYSDGIPTNLRYFKTDFIEKGQTNDDTKELLTEKCADMVRIRENTFELIEHDIDFQLYRNDKYYTAIIFNQYEVENIWHQIEELVEGDKPVHTYIFSYSSHNNEEEIPETKLTYQVQPIPEEILKIYQRIFKKERK